MEFPSLMMLFARVVEAGSFSAASRELDQSPSAVSKQIAHLENRVGVRLLVRSKAGVALTEDGEAFFERCAEIRRQIDAAEELVMSFGDHPKGQLRIVVTTAFGKAQLLPVLPEFLEQNPDVAVDIEFTDRRIDFAASQTDVAIQFTEQIEDQSLVARKLAHNRRVICAAPDYIARHGMPLSPEELLGHNCLELSTVSRFNDWAFEGFEGSRLMLKSSFRANSADALYYAVLAGVGVSRLSTYLVSADLRSGRLIRVMPEYEDNGSDLYAVYSARRNLAPKVRVFIDHLVAQFSPIPPWERDDV